MFYISIIILLPLARGDDSQNWNQLPSMDIMLKQSELITAIRNNQYEKVVDLFIKEGCSPTEMDMHYNRPAKVAFDNGLRGLPISYYIIYHYDVSNTYVAGYTPLLIYAVKLELQPVVDYMIQKGDIDLQVKDVRGWNALHHGAWLNNGNITRSLLTAGAFVDAEENLGKTAAQLAAEVCAVDAGRILLMSGANPFHTDFQGINITSSVNLKHPESGKFLEMFYETLNNPTGAVPPTNQPQPKQHSGKFFNRDEWPDHGRKLLQKDMGENKVTKMITRAVAKALGQKVSKSQVHGFIKKNYCGDVTNNSGKTGTKSVAANKSC